MRHSETRLHLLLLSTVLVGQGVGPAEALGQELPQALSVRGESVQAAPVLSLSADTAADRGSRFAGGLAGAMVGAAAGILIADGVVDTPDMQWVVGAMIGEAIGVPLGVHLSTTPRGNVTWAFLGSSAIAAVAFVAMAETGQPAFLVAAVPLQLVASLRLIR